MAAACVCPRSNVRTCYSLDAKCNLSSTHNLRGCRSDGAITAHTSSSTVSKRFSKIVSAAKQENGPAPRSRAGRSYGGSVTPTAVVGEGGHLRGDLRGRVYAS